MASPEDYQIRVTKDENGSYYWRCQIDYDYFKKGLKGGIIACILISIFILVMGLVFAYMVHDMSASLPVILADIIFIIIFIVIFGGILHVAKDPMETYKMSEEYIQSGSGKSSVYFNFKDTKEVLMSERYIELKGKVKRFRLYFPSDDKNFVRGFITRHIPLDTLVTYEEMGDKKDPV